jgi:outer membrane protein assembly factor BamB
MALDSRGNVVVTGYSTTGFKAWGWPVYTEYYTAKYAAGTGALLWSRICPLWRAATFDANDNVITDRWGDYAKYAAADGALLAEYQFAFAGSANVWDGSGNVVVTGGRFETAKYVAATGAELWRQQFKGPANLADIAQAVAVDGNGNVVVTGYSVGFTNDLESLDYYTAKYAAASGALLWERRYNGPANHDDRPVAMAVDGVGNVVVTGWENNYSSNYTAKYASADGALIWEKRGRVTATGLAVDRGGNVVLTGTYAVDGGLNDFFAAKYAGADGAVLWEKRYHDRADSAYNAAAAAVDGNGDVIVTGPGRTVKFGAAEGTLLWERPTPFNALAIAVDGGGNVAVCGFYATDLNTGQYVTAKYAGADGALLWERHYHGPSDYSRDQATSVAMDGRGDVVVTGYSQSVPGDSNVCYTAKYAAADGALLWEKRSPIEASAVAVDGKGDVILAGTAGLTDNTFDYYIAKYGTATGALLWEKRYNGPANGYDFTRALHPLALGPNGMVAVTGSSYPGPDYATVVYREELPVSLSVRSSANALILSWPTNATGFTLQSTPSLTPPVTWLYVTNPPAVLGGLFTVTNPVSGDSQFFRLKK